MAWYWWLVLVLFIFGLLTYALRKRLHLMMKDKDEALAESLTQVLFWRGQTQVQLIESLGKPLGVDRKALKTKVREVWKYEQTGKNRYGLKITLENGVVVGWRQK